MSKSIEQIIACDDHATRVYEAALWYIRHDIPLLPVMRNGKQLPPAETGINYGSASSKKATIEKWFHPERGKFAGWNIGIACGREGGVMAIDIDQHGGVNGELELQKAMDKLDEELPITSVQLTPSGGRHLLYRWRDGAECTSGKIARCVDTRGGTATACKGHIVAFPSIRNKKMYEWSEWETELPDVPDWVLKIINKEWVAPQGQGRGNELVTSDDVELAIDKSQIERMLAFIDPNECEYEEWLKVGMAIKSQYPEDEGLELWEEWSKDGERFKEGECHIRWRGFAEFGTVRAGTLFYYAKEGGWEPEDDERKGNAFDKIVAEMNEEYAVITVGGKIRILREKDNPFEMDMHYDLYDKDSFKTLNENRTVTVTVNEKKKRIPVANIWLAHEGRRTYINGIGLFPEMETPEGYWNTWNGFSVEPVEGDCHLFLEHIKHIICDDRPEMYEWLIDWISDLLQEPSNPKGCAVVMRGDEGTGKGLLANTIGRIFGYHHRHLIDDSHLTSNFNAHLMDSVTVFADEITWGGNKKTAGKLKGIVTERHLIGERKGVDGVQYRNMVHLFIASNSEWVIPAGNGSRRWFVCDVSPSKKSNEKYFNALVHEINNGGLEAILYFFQNRRVLSNLRLAVETKGLINQRMLNTQDDSVFHWWRKCIISEEVRAEDLSTREQKQWPEVVGKVALYELYEGHVLNRKNRPVIENVFAKRMIEYGVRTKRIKTIHGSNRVRVYELPDVGQAIKRLNLVMPGAIDET